MNNKVWKKYLLPLVTATICLVMIIACVMTATMFLPATEGNFGGNTEVDKGTSTEMVGGLTLPADHNVKVIDPATQLPVGKVRPGYTPQGLQNALAIGSRDELAAWLLTPDNHGRDAYLTNDITFNWELGALKLLDDSTITQLNDWFRCGQYALDGKHSILGGNRVLDGCGYTINYATNGEYKVDAGNGAFGHEDFAQGFFVRELHGKIRNATFSIPTGTFIYSDSYKEMNMHMGMIAGRMSSTGALENVRIDFGASIGRLNSGSDSLTGLKVGVIAGKMDGTLTDCELNINGGTTIRTQAPNGTSEAGLVAGIMNGATVTNLAINYAPKTINVFNDKSDLDRAGLITAVATDVAFKNIIIKNFNFDYANLGHFTYKMTENSTAEGMYLMNTDSLYNFPVREGKQINFNRIETTVEFDFAWNRVESDNMIVVPKLKDTTKLYWGVSQKNGAEQNFDGYSYPTLYRYMIPASTMISIPVITPTTYLQSGSVMNVTTGDVGKITEYVFNNNDQVTSIVDPNDNKKMINTARYTGAAFGVSIKAASVVDGAEWSNANSYNVVQNDRVINQIYGGKKFAGASLPGKYITKIVANTSDEIDAKLFAYLDTVNRRLIIRNDDELQNKCSLTVDSGIANITSKLAGQEPYVEGEWADSVRVTLEVEGLVPVKMSEYPNFARYTFATHAEQLANPYDVQWIGTSPEYTGTTTRFNVTTKVHCDDRPIRFALFQNDIQLTQISEDSLMTKIDGTAPKIDIYTGHAKEYLTARANYNETTLKRMDSFMLNPSAKDDNLEMSQIWLNTTVGASGIAIEARGIKVNDNGEELERTEWGGLSYKPKDMAGEINTNYFAQRMYIEGQTREKNAEYYNGIWRMQFRATNGAGKVARSTGEEFKVNDNGEDILEVVVSIDYSNYTVDDTNISKVWYGSDMGGSDLLIMNSDSCTTRVVYPEGREYFYRNENMNVQVVAPEVVGGYGYSIATINNVAVPASGKFMHTGAYNMANADAIGTTPTVKIALRRYVEGSIGAIDNQTYGQLPPLVNDKITMPEIANGDSVYTATYTQIISTLDKKIYANDNIRIPVGEYIVSAAAAIATGDTTQDERLNAMFELSIASQTYTVTQKVIDVQFDPNTLSSALRNFGRLWIKTLDFTSQIVEGDNVAVTGVYPKVEMPTEEDVIKAPVTLECYVSVNDSNYIVNNTCTVTLVYFETDSEDPSIYLIKTPKDFEAITDNLLGGKFRLNGNIDFKSKRTLGITDFYGEFDGNGYAITNAKIIVRTEGDKDYNVGLFDSLQPGAVVKNLVLDNFIVDVNASGASSLNVGMLAGYVDGATITNIMAQGSLYASGIHSNTHGGGLFGKAKDMTLKNAMSVITMTLVQNITATTGGTIIGGGVVGGMINSAIDNVSSINQGYIHTTLENGAGNICGQQDQGSVVTNVRYLKNALTSGGKVLPQDNNAKVYSEFLADKILYGGVKIREEVRGGNTFESVMTQLIPANMRENGLATLQVKNFKDLVILLNFNFADYEIMNDIHCFAGFKYSGKYMFAGNIINAGGYKVYADNGVFDIAKD